MSAAAIVPGETHWLAIQDQIDSRQASLEAMLTLATCDGGDEAFDSLAPEIRTNYLSACFTAAREIGKLTKLLVKTIREQSV